MSAVKFRQLKSNLVLNYSNSARVLTRRIKNLFGAVNMNKRNKSIRLVAYFIIILSIVITLLKYKQSKLATENQEVQLLYRYRRIFGTDMLATNTKSKISKQNGECELPDLDPFDPDAMKYMGPADKYNCTENYPLLFYTDFASNLIINGTIHKHGFLDCCYKEIFRPVSGIKRAKLIKTAINLIEEQVYGTDYIIDRVYGLAEECVPIRDNITKIPELMDFIAVFCRKESLEHSMVDTFAFFHLKPEVEERIKRSSLAHNDDTVNNKPPAQGLF